MQYSLFPEIKPIPFNNSFKKAMQHVDQNIEEGLNCPLCDQYCKIYKRTVNSGMARWLIRVFLDFGVTEKYFDIRKIRGVRGGDYGKLRYWGLIEQQTSERGAGGMWRLTERGAQFAANEVKIPKQAFVFNNKCQGFSIEKVSIRECVGKKFNYEELMKG